MPPDQQSSLTEPILHRRQLLKAGVVASLVCLSPLSSWAGLLGGTSPKRSLSLLNTHTGEQLDSVVYWEKGRYLTDVMEHINYLLRDHRTEEICSIDPKTIDLMAALSRKLDAGRPFEIISGYRSPRTNEQMRGLNKGVAKNSYHTQGRAVDLRLPGVPLRVVRKAALDLRMGGVGYYPKSDFVHVDTGRVRSW